MLLINQGRRSDKAMHLKLDAVDPDAEHNEIEQLTETEIDGTRNNSSQ